MNNPQNPARLLAAILAGLSTGAVKVTELQIDPNRGIDEQINEVGERLMAQHRKNCPRCAAKYEAAKVPADPNEELREKLRYAHDTDRKLMAERHEYERNKLEQELGAQTGRDMEATTQNMRHAQDAHDAINGAKTVKPTFHEIGFMAFSAEGKPIPGSFNAERAEIEKGFALFQEDPVVQFLNSLTGGLASAGITIRPVYDRRED